MNNVVNEVENLMKSLRDEKYCEFNKKNCPDTKREMLGIRIPVLRKIAKQILKEDDWKKFIENEDVKYFEDVLLKGLVIAYSKLDFNDKTNYIKQFIPQIDSWEITDTFVPTLKIKNEDLENYWNFIIPYFKSENEFEVRFAIISMLDYYLIDEYIDRVINILVNIKHDGYYVKMAVAWTIAEIGIKYNEKAIDILKNNNLDKFTHNKAIQKMIESYRIDDKQKELLKKMKRK